MDSVLTYLAMVAGRTLLQVLVLLGPPLVLGLVMYVVAGFLESRAIAGMGRTLYLVLFGWPGTLVHELGHAMFCPLFGHKITAFQPFSLDPSSRELGYVEHEWNGRSIWARLGNFFIGIGPVVLGTLVLYGASRILLGGDLLGRTPAISSRGDLPTSLDALAGLSSPVLGTILETLYATFRTANLAHWQFWVFLYLAFTVGTSIRLSPSDLKGAGSGFLVMLAILLVLNGCTAWALDLTLPMLKFVAPVIGTFLGVMTLSLTFSALFALPIWCLSCVVARHSPAD